MPYASKVIIKKDDSILILKRSVTDSWRPNKWNLPGGKIDSGEGFLEAAVREVKEETNLTVNGLNEFYHWLDKDIMYYETYDFNGSIQLDYESSDYKWIIYQDLDKLSFASEFAKELIRKSFGPQEIYEDNLDDGSFQSKMKLLNDKSKTRLLKKGGFKFKIKPFTETPSIKRAKSAPPGAGGS